MTDLIIWNAGILCLWASLVTQLVKNPPAMQETLVQFLGWKFPWRWDRLPTPGFLGFPGGLVSKESVCNAGDLGSIYGLGRFPTEGHSHLLQYSFLENPHGQRSLVSYSPWDQKESDTNCTTKHSTHSTVSVLESSYSWLSIHKHSAFLSTFIHLVSSFYFFSSKLWVHFFPKLHLCCHSLYLQLKFTKWNQFCSK